MNIETIRKDLTDVMKEMGTAKASFSKLEGQEFEILRQMKDKLDLSSVESANKEVARIDKLLAKKSEEILSDYKELKANYDW